MLVAWTMGNEHFTEAPAESERFARRVVRCSAEDESGLIELVNWLSDEESELNE
jgi:hypothetical protein